MRYEFRPLAGWPGPVTTDRPPVSRFRADWKDTLRLLGREAELLGAGLVVVQVDVPDAQIRRDGMLRATTRPYSPGVRIAMDTKHGPLTYGTDRYEDWRDNVRAIALSLQALRAVDRYGVSERGEQYRGWLAIDDGAAVKAKAQALIDGYGGLKEALYATHPDRGGTADAFHEVREAQRVLGL